MGFLLTFVAGLFVAFGAATSSRTNDLAAEISREIGTPPEDGVQIIEPPDIAGPVAEDQTPTGQFTTATEVKPILGATKGSWIAVREYDGQDLLYFTNLLAWRCGLVGVAYSVNGADFAPLEIEPCYTETAMPNAIKAEEILPYIALPLGSVATVEVTITYDDLTEETASYSRNEVLMP